jgi:hypothetical protein
MPKRTASLPPQPIEKSNREKAIEFAKHNVPKPKVKPKREDAENEG